MRAKALGGFSAMILLGMRWLTACAPVATPQTEVSTTAVAVVATRSSTFTPTAVPSAAIAPTQTPVPTATPQESITVMTYNILDGGGVGPTDPEGPWCCGPPYLRGCCYAIGGNRLPRILEVIRYADPDIVGIQEAYLWQLDNDALAREVATELGMNYVVGESGDASGANVALFTKFAIKQAENYPDHFKLHAALHVEIVTNSGQPMHVFVVHLRTDEYRDDVSFLTEKMNPYLDEFAVLMGDMNFVDPGSLASILHETGWCHPLGPWQGIDQVWTSPALAPHFQFAPAIPKSLTKGTSDHYPLAVEIGIYPLTGEEKCEP